jgi:hypothetical protein
MYKIFCKIYKSQNKNKNFIKWINNHDREHSLVYSENLWYKSVPQGHSMPVAGNPTLTSAT